MIELKTNSSASQEVSKIILELSEFIETEKFQSQAKNFIKNNDRYIYYDVIDKQLTRKKILGRSAFKLEVSTKVDTMKNRFIKLIDKYLKEFLSLKRVSTRVERYLKCDWPIMEISQIEKEYLNKLMIEGYIYKFSLDKSFYINNNFIFFEDSMLNYISVDKNYLSKTVSEYYSENLEILNLIVDLCSEINKEKIINDFIISYFNINKYTENLRFKNALLRFLIGNELIDSLILLLNTYFSQNFSLYEFNKTYKYIMSRINDNDVITYIKNNMNYELLIIKDFSNNSLTVKEYNHLDRILNSSIYIDNIDTLESFIFDKKKDDALLRINHCNFILFKDAKNYLLEYETFFKNRNTKNSKTIINRIMFLKKSKFIDDINSYTNNKKIILCTIKKD